MPSFSKMKRPAAAAEISGDSGTKKKASKNGSKKKPAGAASTASSLQRAVEDAVGETKHGEAHDDDEGGDNDGGGCIVRRDKGKGEKFAAMLKANALPPHIEHLYNVVAKSKSSPREFRTSIINSLFIKRSNGRYELDDSKPLFVESKEVYERKFGRDTSTAYPRLVMRGMFFANCETAMQQAIEAGDITEVADPSGKDPGTKYYSFRKITVGTEHGTTHRQNLEKKKTATKEQAHSLGDMILALGWTFQYKGHEKIEPGAKMPASMVGLLNQAVDANTKLNTEALKLMPKFLGLMAETLHLKP